MCVHVGDGFGSGLDLSTEVTPPTDGSSVDRSTRREGKREENTQLDYSSLLIPPLPPAKRVWGNRLGLSFVTRNSAFPNATFQVKVSNDI